MYAAESKVISLTSTGRPSPANAVRQIRMTGMPMDRPSRVASSWDGIRLRISSRTEKGADGLLFVGEKGKPFRRSTFGRKWRKARAAVGVPETFRFYDLRHTGHTSTTGSGATLKDTMVRAGQSTERAALIYQHSDLDRQREVAAGPDRLVRERRATADDSASGTDRARDP